MKASKEILAKLKKLLNLAEGAKKIGSLAEAENAALKAQALMTQYNLSLQDLDLSDEEKKLADEVLNPMDLNVKNEGDWLRQLYIVIAKYNYCKAVHKEMLLSEVFWEEYKELNNKRSKLENGSDEWVKVNYQIYKRFYSRGWESKTVYSIRIVGEAHNVEITKYIVEQLANMVRPLARTEFKKYYMNWANEGRSFDDDAKPEKKGAYIRGFLSGFVTGVSNKLYVAQEKIQKEQPKVKEMGLILRNKVEKYYEEKIPLMGMKGKRGLSSNDGTIAGIKAGMRANIHKGVGGTNSQGQKLLG